MTLTKNKTRILVVDDHAITRQGLVNLIETEHDLMVVSEAENAEQAMEAMAKQEFDLALVDIEMEGTNGLELTKKIKLSHPDMIILLFSIYDTQTYSKYAIRAGASGYVSICEGAKNIIKTIRYVLSGKIYVSDN